MSRASLVAMRAPLSHDDVEGLEGSARTPQDHRAAADQLVAWAGEQHPDDVEVTPAALLVAAGWHLEQLGDQERELATLRAAVDAAGSAPPDTRVWLHAALLRQDHAEEAQRLADEIRRSRPDDPDVYEVMGEAYEMRDDLETAHRWFTMGLTRLSRREPGSVSDEALLMLTLARSRVRRELGHPPDAADELGRQQQEIAVARRAAMDG